MRLIPPARGSRSTRSLLRKCGTLAAILFVAAVGLVSFACSDSSSDTSVSDATALQTWATGPVEDVRPDPQAERTDTLHFSTSKNTVEIAGAVNEIVAFEFRMAAGARPISGLRLSVDEFISEAGTIPAEAVRMYRPWPITIERYPNWYLRTYGLRESREIPDILVPIEAPVRGQPFTILSGETLSIWVEVRIPPATAPGEYQTTLSARDFEGHTHKTPIHLVVHDIFLPGDDALPALARVQLAPIIRAYTDLDPDNLARALENEEARNAITKTFALLRDHGLSPYTDEVLPLFLQNQDGRAMLDWSEYDAFCGPFIDGTAYSEDQSVHQRDRKAVAWPLPANLKQPDPSLYGGLDSTVYAGVFKDYLGVAVEHFEKKGWLDRAFVEFDYPQTPNPSDVELGRLRKLAVLTHVVRKNLPFATHLIPQSMIPFGWSEHCFEDLSPEVDIWSPPARYQHGPTLKREQTLGKEVWLRPDRPPFSGSLAVEAPAVHARSLAWQAFLQGHDAIILDHTTDWPADVTETPITDRSQPTDTWLVYPGKPFGLDEPLPSVRLKRLQLGLQDYQYLQMLALEGREETARLLARSLIKAWGTDACGNNYQDGLPDRRIDAPDLWDQARSLMVQELADALRPDPSLPDPNAAQRQSAWIRFLAATRSIRAWCESARLIVDERPNQTGFLARFDIAVRSELRIPIRGQLTFEDMPPGAKSVSDIIHIGPLKEYDFARRELVLGLPALPPVNMDGHFKQRIVCNAGTTGHVSTDAVLAVTQVPPAPTPIVIDGDLNDWPPSQFNIAGDFRLIRAGDHQANRERPRAQSQTVAFFCHDEESVFIGIHAAVPEEAMETARGRRYSNIVAYEDLMPLEDDLVEILIDPSNMAVQNGDLYHIVLKSTGNALFERGIRMTPPIGRTHAWPGTLPRVCVKETEHGWSAEIAIPIDAFGSEKGNAIWGINITRLEPYRGEYSDWARAPRYCYDPRTLGNLVWPDRIPARPNP